MGNNGVKAWMDDEILLRNKDTIWNLMKNSLWKEGHQINNSYQDNSFRIRRK